jgi:tRNA-2-methylthio-N6-dimethylallyladenosine synthase
MKVFLKNYGCQMNVRDSEIICGLLRAKNYELTANPDEADIILFNTCSVRQHAEDRVWSEIGTYKKTPPDLLRKSKQGGISPMKKIIGLIGCMAEYHKYDAFNKAAQIDFVCGPNNIAAIPFLIEQAKLGNARGLAVGQKQRDEFVYNSNFQLEKDKSFVVIAEGCNNFCSYCVVPYVRGMERSRCHQDIIKEIEALVAKGITEITLLGQNVNSYSSHRSQVTGRRPEEKVTFVDLLKMVNEVKGLKSFSFITSHPKDTSKEMFTAMAGLEKLEKQLHLPLQSGSDRILKLMNRGYTLKEYLKRIEEYRKIVGGKLSTDIIVGFPTETEEDFLATKKVLEAVKFDSAYIFKYSLRPHTAASRFPDDVPQEEKEKRHRILLEFQKKISRKKKC